MSSYSYYCVRTIVEGDQPPIAHKFAKGYPVRSTEGARSTVGRYNLLSRLLRGGLSGSGDVYHPANTTFKVRSPNRRLYPPRVTSRIRSNQILTGVLCRTHLSERTVTSVSPVVHFRPRRTLRSSPHLRPLMYVSFIPVDDTSRDD